MDIAKNGIRCYVLTLTNACGAYLLAVHSQLNLTTGSYFTQRPLDVRISRFRLLIFIPYFLPPPIPHGFVKSPEVSLSFKAYSLPHCFTRSRFSLLMVSSTQEACSSSLHLFVAFCSCRIKDKNSTIAHLGEGSSNIKVLFINKSLWVRIIHVLWTGGRSHVR